MSAKYFFYTTRDFFSYAKNAKNQQLPQLKQYLKVRIEKKKTYVEQIYTIHIKQ